MPANSDLLFGKIAVSLGFCTQEQVDRALEIQEAAPQRAPLGRHLVDEGFLTEDHHSKVLEIQRRNMLKIDPVAKVKREDILLGKLAVREGYIAQADLNEALRRQGAKGERRSLGEILVADGLLTSTQVKTLLGLQSKKIMSCETCRMSFTVLTISRRLLIDCPRCKKPLQEGKPTDSVRTDAQLQTGMVRALSGEKPPPAPDAQAAPCKICDHPFVTPPDSSGRVDCLSCGASYLPPPA